MFGAESGDSGLHYGFIDAPRQEMSSELLSVDAQLPVVAVDYMRRERGGAVLQCGGNDRGALQ